MDEAETLAAPACACKWHLIVYGILVPAVITCFAVMSWLYREALWISSEGITSDTINGDAARAMAIVYLCAGSYMHFRSFWGALGFEKTSRAGVMIALYIGIGAMLTTLGLWIAGA